MNLPAFHGNWVDLLIIFFTIFYLAGGWRRGFILGILDLFGFLVSFFSALRFYSFFGLLLIANFSIPKGIAYAVGFLLAGMISEMCLSIFIQFVVKKFYPKIIAHVKQNRKLMLIFRLDKIFGFIPAIGEAIIFTAFILTLLVTLPIAGAIKKDIVSSKIGEPLVGKTSGIERQLNIIFGQAINETLTFLTINPNPISNERVNLGFNQLEVKVDETAEQEMLDLINSERSKTGLLPLILSLSLRDLARNYAEDIFARGYFAHYNPEGQSPFDRMEQRGIKFIAAGENLALAPNVYLAHQGLMNSEGHRANILSADFGKVGIGVIDGGIYGEMFVQEFTN